MIPNSDNIPVFDPELARRLAEAARAPFEAFARATEALRPLQEATERFNESMTRSLEPLRETLERLPGETKKALTVLGEHGWYVDMAMPLPAPSTCRNCLSREIRRKPKPGSPIITEKGCLIS